MRWTLGLILLVVLLVALPATAATDYGTGKFYIVGMGTAPDLITVRGAEVVKAADIILLEEPSERDYWQSFIGDKEVWFCAHGSRVGFGLDPKNVKDADVRAIIEKNAKIRQDTVEKIQQAVKDGKTVAALEGGDPMVYGTTFYLEMLPKDFPSEIVPGIGAFNACSAAVKWSPTFGRDTNSVIVTMGDFPGRTDTNEKLMATKTSLVIFGMAVKFPELFAQLQKHYPPSTPVAVVSFAGDREKQQVVRSTVSRFLTEVDYKALPPDSWTLLVGKFLEVGQGRVDALLGQGSTEAKREHGGTPTK
jgi:precorrin-4/cobalt-precorrin-4 C11-methyltransferase